MTLRRDELRSAIERVAQFADERSRAIRVQIRARRSARFIRLCRKRARAKRRFRPSTQGPQTEIGFNAQYLLDFLRASSEENVSFHFSDRTERGRNAAGRRRRRAASTAT